MRILIDMGHPGHVHLFKHFIREMRERKHEVLITARDKKIIRDLLQCYDLDFQTVGRVREGVFSLFLEWAQRDIGIYRIARRFRPDLLIGVGNPSIAHAATLLRKPSIIFTDTEHARLGNGITFPFADVVCTPSCYRDDLGEKQVRYDGYHDLAYLHPDRFTPDPGVLDEIGIKPDERFIVVRFVSWNASHDVGQHGIRDRIGLVRALEPYGRVMITSEGQVPNELQDHQIRIPPEKLHDLLYFATLCVGEGGTTASEAAVLGTPAIFVSTTAKHCGVFDGLAAFGLLWTTESDRDAISRAITLLQDPALKEAAAVKRARLVDAKVDVTAFMTWFVENYPASRQAMKSGPRDLTVRDR
jgi:predicted glycosyltransferase